MPFLIKLKNYKNILICDDSGSMNNLADPDVDNVLTRWTELKQLTRITIDAMQSIDSTVDI